MNLFIKSSFRGEWGLKWVNSHCLKHYKVFKTFKLFIILFVYRVSCEEKLDEKNKLKHKKTVVSAFQRGDNAWLGR